MLLINKPNGNYTARQLKLPLEIEKLIDISDPVYTFCEVMDHIDLSGYFVEEKGDKTGRPRCDAEKLLKVILFAFMEHGFCSLREIEKLCRTDIRYMYLLDEMKAPSFATFGNFIRNELTDTIEQIFADVNAYIFEKDHVDLDHTYIDGTKIEANANKYTWVWKKSCIKNRDKMFVKISELIDSMNVEVLNLFGLKFDTREEYAIEYLETMLDKYESITGLDKSSFVYGTGRRKSLYQKQYETLSGYCERLKNYARHIEICGESRNSYSKTDHDATFMRVKSDYMGNDQLLPAYNLQAAICDEYIAVIDAKPYASDIECFVPLMEKYMKFTMFYNETKDSKYHNNPFRVDNFKRDEKGNLICPNGKRFLYKYDKHVHGNKYGRTKEIYECEDCTNCPYKGECCKRTSGNRTARLNRELTAIHHEVIDNLESVHGALLRMNRSIQAEGTFGVIKWDRTYKRLFRRGEKAVILEFTLISCGFNLYKYHNKINRQTLAA